MRMWELNGKRVIGSKAQILGTVCDVEFDLQTWQVTNFCLDLEKNVIETMGFQKPRLMGSIKVIIPIEEITAISDVVTLKKSADELKGIAKKI